MFNVIIVAILAYLLGSVPFGWLIGKAHGVDIRQLGSHNIGATNVTRTIGKGAGILCFIADFLKGAIAVAIARHLAAAVPGALVVALFCVVLGHMFPIYLNFKGGKGIATAAGAAFAIAPAPVIIALAAWLVVFHVTRYVSLASIVAAVLLPLSALLLLICGHPVGGWPAVIAFAVIGALAVGRHKSNIERLLHGTESRFERKKR